MLNAFAALNFFLTKHYYNSKVIRSKTAEEENVYAQLYIKHDLIMEMWQGQMVAWV